MLKLLKRVKALEKSIKELTDSYIELRDKFNKEYDETHPVVMGRREQK